MEDLVAYSSEAATNYTPLASPSLTAVAKVFGLSVLGCRRTLTDSVEEELLPLWI